MLRDQVDEIHQLRRNLAELEAEIDRKIDALVISVVSEHGEKTFSERDIAVALQAAGFEIALKDVYPLVTRLVSAMVIERTGLSYKAIRPAVMKRQLLETPPKG